MFIVCCHAEPIIVQYLPSGSNTPDDYASPKERQEMTTISLNTATIAQKDPRLQIEITANAGFSAIGLWISDLGWDADDEYLQEIASGSITNGETKALEACIKRMRRLIDKGDIQGYLREDVSFHYQWQTRRVTATSSTCSSRSGASWNSSSGLYSTARRS